MTSEERWKYIKFLVEKTKKKSKQGTKKSNEDFVPLEPVAPSQQDISEEYNNLVRYSADQYINYEE